jgi:UDP-2,3-diacylglucosamine hydrolase
MPDLLFISDLHLAGERPAQLALFHRLMEGPARRAGAVYILGDLFEHFWAGNDDRTPPAGEILSTLRALTDSGVPCHFIRGNRELMVDAGFGALTGCRLLPDPSVIEVHGRPALIMHGDRLCTRDRSYQAFRATMEWPPVKRLFLALPAKARLGLAHGLRPAFRKHVEYKAPAIIDVDPGAVADAMRAHGVTELIHGHTHRPGEHRFDLDGRPARRFVLGDWYGDPLMLVCRADEARLVRVEDYCSENL